MLENTCINLAVTIRMTQIERQMAIAVYVTLHNHAYDLRQI